jgi:flagellin
MTKMVSVNTNMGAMVALQALTQTQTDLNTTQNRISTGLKVATAKDNAAVFSIAQKMRGDVGAYQAVSQSLSNAGSTVDVATAAAQSVSDLLVQMKQKAVAAADTSLDATSLTALNNDYVALKTQVDTVIANASFNGVNMLDSTAGASYKATINAITTTDATGSIAVTAGLDFHTVTAALGTLSSAAAAVTEAGAVDTQAAAVNAALAKLGSGSKQLDMQQTFVSKLSDALNAGIGHLVDADMASESAKLQSLQVKQQLGVQALSIANQSPQVLLSLFR